MSPRSGPPPGEGGQAGARPRDAVSPARLAWMAIAGLAVALLALAPASAAEPGTEPETAAEQAAGAELVPRPAPEPDGYRMDQYRAPTPATLRGARVIDTAEAETLWRSKTVLFVDVMPRDVKPPNLPAGTIWRDKKREDIPGSAWLPNVGYGELNAHMDGYFRGGLEGLTEGRLDTPLVFYCKSECWMSWNAAKRALEYGFTNVTWYPGGSDGWAKAGLPLELAVPWQ